MRRREEPITRYCSACQAKPGDRCTRPDDFGRHEVRTFHLARLTGPKVAPTEPWLTTDSRPLGAGIPKGNQ